MSSRLRLFLGPLTCLALQPRTSAVFCFVAWLITLPITWQEPWLAMLAFFAIWFLTVSLSLEAPLLQSLPLPPLTVLFLGLCLRWGVGPLLLAIGGSGGDSFLDVWVKYGPPSQFLWITFSSTLLSTSLIHRGSIARAAIRQPKTTWLLKAAESRHFANQLRVIIFILAIYMFAYIILSTLTGAFDRQFDTTLELGQRLWRLNTPVVAFSRLRDLWFLLFPLSIYLLKAPWRLVQWLLLAAFFSSAILSGSRGLLFYPLLLILFGLWFVLSDPRLLRRLGIFLAILVIFLSPLIYVVRESSAFQYSKSLQDRIHSVGIAFTQPDLLLQKARWLGRDLYACHDPYLFTPRNRDLPPVGSRGLDAMLYLWLPKHIVPDRPTLFDGHIIAKGLQRVKPDTWTTVWFPCFSLPADLMRRWSLPGLFIGSLVVSIIFQSLFYLWYRIVNVSGSTFQILILLLPATYLQSFPLGTVLETSWSLLWELPKYIVTFWLLGLLADRLLTRFET